MGIPRPKAEGRRRPSLPARKSRGNENAVARIDDIAVAIAKFLAAEGLTATPDRVKNASEVLRYFVDDNLQGLISDRKAFAAAMFIFIFLTDQDIKSASRSTYVRTAKPFFTWWRTEGTRELTRPDILDYRTHLGGMNLSPLTVSAYLVVVRRFYEWAEATRKVPNVARGVKGPKRVRGFRKDSLTLPQLKELLAGVDRSTVGGKRDFAILNLLVRTGLRTIELVRADVGDIRQQSGEAVLWIQGKGRDAKDEFVLLTADAMKPIYDYLAARGSSPDAAPLFASSSNRNRKSRLTTRSISRIVKDSLVAIGLNTGRLTAHSLRHTAITMALQAGATVQEAQRMGRHASIETTMIYAHNIDRIGNAPEKKIAQLLKDLDVG